MNKIAEAPGPGPAPAESMVHANIYVALAAAQAEFTPVIKSKVGKVKGQSKASGKDYEYEYRYADLGDVLKMAIPILARHGICVLQPLTRREGKLYLVTHLVHGSSETRVSSDGLELDEKASAQDFGGEQTYWRRYDFSSLAGIATEEDMDSPKNKAARSEGRAANTANVQQDPLEQRVRQLCKVKGFTEPQVAIRMQKYKGRLGALIAELEGTPAPSQEEPQASIDRNADLRIQDGDLQGELDTFAPPPGKHHPSGCTCNECLPFPADDNRKTRPVETPKGLPLNFDKNKTTRTATPPRAKAEGKYGF